MSDSNYQTPELTIAANSSETLHIGGRYFAALEADAKFKVAFDDGPSGNFEKGMMLSFASGFAKVKLINDTAAPIAVEVGISNGLIRDARLNVAGSINAKPVVPDVFTEHPETAVAFGVAPSVLAANANRNEALFVNTGTVELWIKSTNGTSKAGSKLAAGQPLVVEHTAEVFAYNPDGATNGSLSISETEFS